VNTETTNPNFSEAPGEASNGNPVANPAAEQLTALRSEVDQLTAEKEQLLKEKLELQDRVLRLQAEFDNFRKRSEKDRSEFVQYAGMELIRELLPVLDNFELALKVEPTGKDYAKGVEMIYQRMADTLRKAGLEPIEAEGKTFDPHIHQAVEKVQTGDVPDETILGEFQRGYKYKGKLLRASMVKVAVHPS
jgi:molecular chaperone GrpE